MARRVELLPRAERELAALSEAAQAQVIAKLEMLREFPELGAPMIDGFEGYRALRAGRRTYRIIYQVVSPDRVEVAYIRHCARQTSLRIVRGRKG